MERGARAARGRRTASVALTVVAAVLVLLGSVFFWAREEVFDAEGFADHASAALEDDRVRAAIGGPITDQVIANGPEELINVRPLVEGAVEGVIGSAPFRDVFADGVQRAHRTLFSRDRDELVLQLADTGALVIDAIDSIAPRIGKQLPNDLRAGLIEITDHNFAIDAVRTAEEVRFLGLVLPILALLCLAGSIALANDRRRAIVVNAGGIAASAVIGLVALLIGRALLLGQFDDDLTADAVAAVWDEYVRGLEAWFFVLGAVAIVLAAAGHAARPVDVAAPARRLAEALRRTPRSAGWRAARAVVLIAVGLLAVLRPDLMLHVLIILVGAYTIFFGASELFLLIAPPKAERPEPLRQRLRPGRLLAAAGAAALVAVVAVIIAAVGGGEATGRPPGPLVNCNGYRELCDRSLNEVAFPGAHNAMSAASDDFITPNHETGIRQQLDSGIRALLIDAHYGIAPESGPVITDLQREDKGKVTEAIKEQFGANAVDRVESITKRAAGGGEPGTYLCHVVCELGAIPLTDALGWIREFLDTHPDEVLLVFIEDYVKPADIEAAFDEAGLTPYAYAHETGAPLPTLRELIELDKRLVVMAENDPGGGSIPWYLDGFELFQETPFTFDSAAALNDPKSCEPNRGGTRPPMFLLNHWVEKLPRLPSVGSEVNAFDFLDRRAGECRHERGLLPNILAVDFHDQGDVLGVARKLNGLAPDANPHYRETG